MALSRIFWSAASAFAISSHWARGIFQNETYEYIRGFSLTSDICACADEMQTADIAIVHSPAKLSTVSCSLIFVLRDLAQEVQVGTSGHGSVHQSSRRNSSRLLPALGGIGPVEIGQAGQISCRLLYSR